jgi:hypothetical protein
VKISKVIETPQGTAKFEGEVSQEEFDYIVQTGLNALLVMGAIKTSVREIKDDVAPEGTPLQ